MYVCICVFIVYSEADKMQLLITSTITDVCIEMCKSVLIERAHKQFHHCMDNASHSKKIVLLNILYCWNWIIVSRSEKSRKVLLGLCKDKICLFYFLFVLFKQIGRSRITLFANSWTQQLRIILIVIIIVNFDFGTLKTIINYYCAMKKEKINYLNSS